MSNTTLQRAEGETLRAVAEPAAHEGPALAPRVVLALGGGLTVAWTAILVWGFVKLAYWVMS